MGSKSSSFLYLALLLAFSSAIHALDITKMLGQYPEYATFNKYLTETKLADEINKRNTITVLVVDDAGLSSISGKSQPAIKAIISTHVVLDYFDEKKLMEALGSNQPLTTLYQASGLATNQQGFIKVAQVGEGNLAFGSAASGAPTDAELVKTVTTEPFNISILQVTKPILFPGVDSSQSPSTPSGSQSPPQGATKAPSASTTTPTPTPPQAAKAPAASTTTPTPTPPQQAAKAPAATETAKAPAASQTAKAPTPPAQGTSAPVPLSSSGAKAPTSAQSAKSPVPAENGNAPTSPAQGDSAPAPSETTTASSPSESPVAESPTEAAGAPETTVPGPTVSEAPALAPGPVGDEAAAADTPASGSSSFTKMGLVGAVMGFASLLFVF